MVPSAGIMSQNEKNYKESRFIVIHCCKVNFTRTDKCYNDSKTLINNDMELKCLCSFALNFFIYLTGVYSYNEYNMKPVTILRTFHVF